MPLGSYELEIDWKFQNLLQMFLNFTKKIWILDKIYLFMKNVNLVLVKDLPLT